MAEIRKNSLPQGKAQQSVIQYQIFSPENTYASKTIQIEQAVSGIDMYLHIHMCMHQLMKRKAMGLKESKGSMWKNLEGGKGGEK